MEAGAHSAMLAALIGAALTLLLVGAFYNLSLALAVLRHFLLWHGVWAARVLVWGTIWSQLELIVVPGLAGTAAAQICTFLACIAITAATVSAVTSVERSILPRWASVTTIARSEEHTSELQSLMRISYAVSCLKKKTQKYN